MKFTCDQEALNLNLGLVNRAVSARPTHPILSTVLINSVDGTISLTGFDLSLGIETSLEAEIEESGSLALPAKLLGEIIAKLPSGEVTIENESGDHLVTITSSSGRYQLRGLDTNEYPALPVIEEGQSHDLKIIDFVDGLRGSIESTSQDESKQVLTGVYLNSQPAMLEFAATDGHRLGIVEIYPEDQTQDENQEPARPFNVVIPAKSMRELDKMLGHSKATKISLQLEDGQVVFRFGNQRLTSRTLEGKYPDYRLLVPKNFARQLTLDRRQLLAALERIAVVSDATNLVKFVIDSNKQKLNVSVDNQTGNGIESLSIQVSGQSLNLAFNIKYLIDGLKILPTQDITISLNGPLEPVIIAPVGGVKMTYLIMPVQLRD
jgi:DNA polymerase III subunit beta